MAEGMSNVLLYVARVLRDQLEDLLLGIAEAPDLQTTLALAAPDILVSQGALQTLRRQDSLRVPAAKARKLPPPRHSGNEESIINANVWNALPPQLLDLVFAHLPVPDIQRLRFLSKEWRRSVESPVSEFRRVCAAEVCSSSRFAVICPGNRDGKFSVNTFDLRTAQWQAFEFRFPRHRWNVTLCACDGGLVCLLYRSAEFWSEEELGPAGVCMSVWNPVTRGEARLPLLPVSDFLECAAKLSVDHQTDSFRVLFVTTETSSRRDVTTAHVFDSVSWDWVTAEKTSAAILWSSYRCAGPDSRTGLDGVLAGFCSYAAGKLKSRSSEYANLNGLRVRTVAFTENRSFLLLQNDAGASEYKIYEYKIAEDGSGVMKFNKSFRCPPLAKFPQGVCKVELQACRNLLILGARSPQQRRRWLLDLSTDKWRDLPGLPEDKTSSHVEYVLCELQWKLCPRALENRSRKGFSVVDGLNVLDDLNVFDCVNGFDGLYDQPGFL